MTNFNIGGLVFNIEDSIVRKIPYLNSIVNCDKESTLPLQRRLAIIT